MYANYKILPSFIHWFLTIQCPQSSALSGTGGFQRWGFPGVVHWSLTPHCWDSPWPVTGSTACLLDEINKTLQTRTLQKIEPEGQTKVHSLQKLIHNFQEWSSGFIFLPKNNPKPDTEWVISIDLKRKQVNHHTCPNEDICCMCCWAISLLGFPDSPIANRHCVPGVIYLASPT